MKKLKLITALAILPALLGSCSLIDQIFGGGEDTYESSSSSSSSESSSSTPKGVTAIALDQHSLSLDGGESYKFTVSFTPSSTINKKLDWESSNSSVASISADGTVIAQSMGNCDITCYYRSNHDIFDVCHVEVVSEYACRDKTNIVQTYQTLSTHSAYGSGGVICPTTGTPKLLIIPVWFEDSSNYIDVSKKADVRSDIEKVYLGTSEQTGWHSVRSYYFQESFGAVTINGTVSEWYEPEDVYMTDLASDDGYCTNTKQFVIDAADWYFDGHSSDSRKNYDSNNDGYIDGVMLIYAAPDYRVLNDKTKDNLWAYKFATGASRSVANPSANVFFWASYDFMYGDNTVTARTGHEYANGDTSHCSIDAHTFIHEMGHVFGLDDYYDYGDDDICPAGGFSMQDYNVGGHDAFSVMAYGWADPYIPAKSCQITINDFQSSHDMILLSAGSFNSSASVFDEYLLLELYTPTGLNKLDSDYVYDASYPQGPSVAGIRLWHVDARLVNYWSGETGITDATSGDYLLHMNNNSYSGERVSGYSPAEWNLLQLIRNSSSKTYNSKAVLEAADLYKQGDTFTFNNVRNQFYQSTFNNGEQCKWSFTVDSIAPNELDSTVTTATISVVLSA